MAKINTTISAEVSIQAMAGTANAMTRPRLQTCQENTCRPAVKVPSASKVKTAIAVELAVKFLCTLGSNSTFITTIKASQCSACEPINISRAVLSAALGHPEPMQTSAISGSMSSQKPTIGCLEKLVYATPSVVRISTTAKGSSLSQKLRRGKARGAADDKGDCEVCEPVSVLLMSDPRLSSRRARS